MTISSKQKGELGEAIAKCYLKQRKYKILATNYCPSFAKEFGEIDIVAQPGGSWLEFFKPRPKSVHFIEVKTSTAPPFIAPEQRVNYKKQVKLKKLAHFFLNEHQISLDSKWQIDILAIQVDSDLWNRLDSEFSPEILSRFKDKIKIKHFENAIGE